MITTVIKCDTCGKECKAENGVSHFQGKIARLAMEKESLNVNKQMYQFAQDFCPECSEVILNFTVALKKDIKKVDSKKN